VQFLARRRSHAGDMRDAADRVRASDQLLTIHRGWSPERYEHFLADTWRRLLLP
jgi:hypothetical protein